jgi:hypothetical protein
MSKEKGVLRAVLVPALVAMGAVGLFAFLWSGRARQEHATSAPQPVRPEPALPSEPAAPAPGPAPTAPLELAQQPALPEAALAAAALAGQPEAGPPAVIDATAFTPEVREHALKMIPLTVLQAVEQENLAHVRSLRDQLSARAADGLLSRSDLEALDLVVECMEHAPEARDEGRDFLQFGAATIMREALKRACDQ